ncbi:MAG TPA: plastocyanin/azurin family copper-binding protein [Frankiaceae bacterium]|jgi:glucose/arabinose dehydrogenase/plastocyanin|nr:plastocyanin/azurin family copper-binding protein [Frankiaceae bacterium]
MRRAVLVVAALLATSLTPSHAADGVVVAAGIRFVNPDVTIGQGGRLTFANPDVAPHNVVAEASDRNGPLFASTTVTTGGTAEVKGVERLAPSTYTFLCTLHPTMRGTLTVTKPGTAAIAPTPTGANVPTPTSLTVHDGALYVVSYASGSVLSMPVLPGGALGPATPYATGFTDPLGLAFAPDGTLYVSDSHSAGGRTVGRVWAVRNGASTVAIDGLPNGRHNTNGLLVSGSRLYVANGNATDDGVNGGDPELPLNGTVLSYAVPIAKNARPTVEARGLRNPYDLALRPGTNEVWFPTNGPDDLDPLGEDLLHKVDVRRGTADFGFPACLYDAALRRAQNPRVKTACRPNATPERALGLHVSANGIAFGTGGAWGNDVYVAEYGSNAPSGSGHRVVRVPIVGGKAGAPQDVFVGPSPLDVAFGPDGLYVADFATGAITLLRAVG